MNKTNNAKMTLTALAIGAALTSNGVWAGPAACQADTDIAIADLVSMGSCIQEDKIWGNFSFAGLPTNTTGSFSLVNVGPGVTNHSFTLTFNTPITDLTGGGSYGYSVYVDTTLSPNKYFSRISLGANISDSPSDLTYVAIGDVGPSYTIINTGGVGGTYDLDTAGNERSFAVSNVIAPGTGSQLNSITHTYRQFDAQIIPEIDALAGTGALTLLGGSLALAGERRRRKA